MLDFYFFTSPIIFYRYVYLWYINIYLSIYYKCIIYLFQLLLIHGIKTKFSDYLNCRQLHTVYGFYYQRFDFKSVKVLSTNICDRL